jgi:hypothetical protein
MKQENLFFPNCLSKFKQNRVFFVLARMLLLTYRRIDSFPFDLKFTHLK